MGDGTESRRRYRTPEPTLEQLQQMQDWAQYLPSPRDGTVFLNEIALIIFARLMGVAHDDLMTRLGREPKSEEWAPVVAGLPQDKAIITTLKNINEALLREGTGIFEKGEPVYGSRSETDQQIIGYRYRQVLSPEQALAAVQAYQHRHFLPRARSLLEM